MTDKRSNFGFVFDYKHRRIGKSEIILPDDVARLPAYKRNLDVVPLYVYCVDCEEFMDFTADVAQEMAGNWCCPECHKRVRERTVYAQLNRENENISDVCDSPEMPDYCHACGGPWPNCISSCKLFDD